VSHRGEKERLSFLLSLFDSFFFLFLFQLSSLSVTSTIFFYAEMAKYQRKIWPKSIQFKYFSPKNSSFFNSKSLIHFCKE